MYSPFREGNFPLCQIVAGAAAVSASSKEGRIVEVMENLVNAPLLSSRARVRLPGANAVGPPHLLFPYFSNLVARYEPFEIVIGTQSGSTLA